RPSPDHRANPPLSSHRRTAACAAALAGDRCTGWSDDCPEGRPARRSATARKCRSAFAPLHLLRLASLLRFELEQPRGRAAEDVCLLVVAERCRRKDRVDGMHLPEIWIVAAEHDLARADLCHQMADRFGFEDQRIKIDLLQILRRL